jgi:hypothetical protein
MVFAVTMVSSASRTDEPLPDDTASRMPVGDRPHADYDSVGSLFFDPRLSINLPRNTSIDTRATDTQSDGALTSPELTIRRGILPSIDGQYPSRFSDIPTYSLNREAL